MDFRQFVGQQVMKQLSTNQVAQKEEIFSVHQRSVHFHRWAPYTDAPSAQYHRTNVVGVVSGLSVRLLLLRGQVVPLTRSQSVCPAVSS